METLTGPSGMYRNLAPHNRVGAFLYLKQDTPHTNSPLFFIFVQFTKINNRKGVLVELFQDIENGVVPKGIPHD